MSPGQARALNELKRIEAADPNTLDIVSEPSMAGDSLTITVSIRIGALEKAPGGLPLREREEFELIVPPDFPFDQPYIRVEHTRFAGFNHVTWSRWLCLYQSKTEWNPSDGLYGFLDRLSLWLQHAARNDMDPEGGPLEPPHHATDFSHLPIVVRANAPTGINQRWLGWAELVRYDNRIELVGWRGFAEPRTPDRDVAIAIFLTEQLPMEFPANGGELLDELIKQGLDKDVLIPLLAFAAHRTVEGQPVRLALGLPMRRAPDGSTRYHIAMWATEVRFAESLRNTLPKEYDTEELEQLRGELADAIWELFRASTMRWCRVMEDRSEIVTRRDARTPLQWFTGKRVLVLGCGALGSWVAEFVVRAGVAALHLVDNGAVKPGILVRQNFVAADISENKATALTARLKTLDLNAEILGFPIDAHRYLLSNRESLGTYDLVIDCTASTQLQMKIERDWVLLHDQLPRIASFVIDAHASRCIGVSGPAISNEGIWSKYLRLKNELCTQDRYADVAAAFYGDPTQRRLFQPEPGCSEPTFVGSAADVSALAGVALNAIASHANTDAPTAGFAFALPGVPGSGSNNLRLELPDCEIVTAGTYRVLITSQVFDQARRHVGENNDKRTAAHETGGLLWGYWDDAAQIILILDASGPPPDSRHDPAHFQCGKHGTIEEHESRMTHSSGVCGFVGFWHTHPGIASRQSDEDVLGMTSLVASMGSNSRRALMLIFGRTGVQSTAGIYVYESAGVSNGIELLRVGDVQMTTSAPVV